MKTIILVLSIITFLPRNSFAQNSGEGLTHKERTLVGLTTSFTLLSIADRLGVKADEHAWLRTKAHQYAKSNMDLLTPHDIKQVFGTRLQGRLDLRNHLKQEAQWYLDQSESSQLDRTSAQFFRDKHQFLLDKAAKLDAEITDQFLLRVKHIEKNIADYRVRAPGAVKFYEQIQAKGYRDFKIYTRSRTSINTLAALTLAYSAYSFWLSTKDAEATVAPIAIQ